MEEANDLSRLPIINNRLGLKPGSNSPVVVTSASHFPLLIRFSTLQMVLMHSHHSVSPDPRAIAQSVLSDILIYHELRATEKGQPHSRGYSSKTKLPPSQEWWHSLGTEASRPWAVGSLLPSLGRQVGMNKKDIGSCT